MKYNSNKHHRQSIRMREYDYTQAAAYFVTICTYQGECLFGKVINDEMICNEFGRIVQACWEEIPCHFDHVELNAFVVMPNHVHGIIVITDRRSHVGAQHAAPLQSLQTQTPPSITTRVSPQQPPKNTSVNVFSGSLGAVVRSFKSATTRVINELRQTPGVPVWQRNYYEHIVRGEESLDRICDYIINNPLNWESDQENPMVGVGTQHAAPLQNHHASKRRNPWEV